jgi:hypothetical protein
VLKARQVKMAQQVPKAKTELKVKLGLVAQMAQLVLRVKLDNEVKLV